MDAKSSELVIKDKPILLMVITVVTLGVGVYFYLRYPAYWMVLAITVVTTMVLFSVIPIVEIRADRDSRTLTITRRFPFRVTHQRLAFDDIQAIHLSSSVGYESSNKIYRIEVMLKNGDVIPIRKVYSSGKTRKEAMAKQISDFTGIECFDPATMSPNPNQEAMLREYQHDQESITGPQGEEQTTDGVRWVFQTLTIGNAPLSHWHSPDVKLDKAFLFMIQKPPQQNKFLEIKWVKSIGDELVRKSMKVYGFKEDDTPDLSTATLIDLPAELSQHYMGFSDEPDRVRRLVTPWVARPLLDWAVKYPISVENIENHLTIHLGPRGLSLRTPGLVNPEYLDDLIAMGVELVKSFPT